MKRSILIALALSLSTSGCFVADELDGGMASMKKPRPGSDAKAESKPSETGDDSGSLVDTGRDALASVGGWIDELGEPEPDPTDEIVRCRMGGSVQFTRESTCRARGGVPEER